MKKKVGGLLLVVTGILLMIGAIALEIAWLAFCFGTVTYPPKTVP